jgi:flavin-dependent thymidylate synthase
MKIVTPKVYMVGSTQFLKAELEQYLVETGNEEFLDILTGCDQMDICSFYAKLCYKSLSLGKNRNISKTRDIESNVRGIIDSLHFSVLEHSHLNFVCENVSRIFHTELIRHRHNNYSIESGRYVIQEEMGIWIPNYLRERGEKYVNDYIEAQRKIEKIYVDFLNLLTEGLTTFEEKKMATSCARRLKPLGATETVGFTMNLRAFREILVRRTSKHAEEEIRLVFNQIADLVLNKIPVLKHGLKIEKVRGLLEYS